MEKNVKELYLETTTLDNGHVHTFYIENGNGETLRTIFLEKEGTEHIHKIENFEVLRTDEHMHYIKSKTENDLEEKNENKEKVKEISIILNTGLETSIEHITEHINGKLVGIIIDTNKSIGINIALNQFNEISVYNKVDFHGQKYLSLINDATFPNNEKSQSSNQNWYLNDRLRLHVEGNIDTTVKLVIRYI